MVHTNTIEQVSVNLDIVHKQKRKCDHLNEYINVLEQRNRYLMKLCNVIIIILYFLFLSVQLWPMTCSTQIQQVIVSVVSLGKWPIGIIAIVLYVYEMCIRDRYMIFNHREVRIRLIKMVMIARATITLGNAVSYTHLLKWIMEYFLRQKKIKKIMG